MATTAKANILLHVDMTLLAAAIAGVQPAWQGQLDYSQAFASGVGAAQFDMGYLAERSVNASSNDDIDLSGVLLDALGQTITPVELAFIFIINKPLDPTAAPNVSNLTVGLGSNPLILFGGTTPTSPILRPGAFMCMGGPDAAGLAVITAATGDILRIANGAGGTAKYQIAIGARSA